MAGKNKQNRAVRVPRHRALAKVQDVVSEGPDITVIYRKDGDTLNAVVTAPHYESFDVDLLQTAMGARYKRLTLLLERLLASKAGLYDLAHVGHELFKILLPTARLQELLTREVSVTEPGGSGDPECSAPLRIDIITRNFGFPFGLLYVVDPDQDLNARHFLCVRNVVNRIPDESGFLYSRSPLLASSDPAISYALNSNLGQALQREVPHLLKLRRKRGALHGSVVRNLGPFRRTSGNGGCQELRSAMQAHAAEINHFACHAWSDADGRPAGFMIDDNYEVVTDMLQKGGFTLERGPVIFFNACEMGFDSSDSFKTFLHLFFDMNARAILAPECKIDDGRAADFSVAFYKHFIRRHEPIADAVWLARIERLKKGDFSGLAYSLFGQPETYIAPRAAAA